MIEHAVEYVISQGTKNLVDIGLIMRMNGEYIELNIISNDET
jgi:hypothetical protein